MDTCLTREVILKVSDLPQEKLAIPEWGGHVFVRTLSGHERGELEKRFTADSARKEPAGFRATLLCLTLVDGEGKTLFGLGDVEVLGKKSALVIERLFDVASRLNGFTKRDVEELEKNSEPPPSDASGSS